MNAFFTMSTEGEPEKPEPEKPEPEEMEPEEMEPKETEPKETEPEKPEPEETEPEKPEPEETEPEKPEREKREREKSETKIYYCEMCKVPCQSAMILQTHFAGMRHKKRERVLKTKWSPVIYEEPPSDRRPLSKTIRCLKDYMKDPNRDEPLIGLEYVLEIRFQGRRYPRYECQLCKFDTEIVPMIEHLTGQRHRKEYLVKHFPDRGKRKPNDTKEDRASFLKRIAREIEKEEGLKMYKSENYERPSVTSASAVRRAKWAGSFYKPENDPYLRQKALEYMDFFEVTSDTEATQVIRIAQSLSEALKAFCEKQAAIKHIRSLPPLLPPGQKNTRHQKLNKPNKPHETFSDNPGDKEWTQGPPSNGLAQLQSILAQSSSASHTRQMRERVSSYTVSSSDLATVSALGTSLAPQSGNSAGGVSEWMRKFASASANFQSNPVREKSLSGTTSESSFPTWYHQGSSTQKYNRMADTGIKSWDSMRDSYDRNNSEISVSRPAASNSLLGWPPLSGYQQPNLQADGKGYQTPFSAGSLYSGYQQQNLELNNPIGQSPAGLSSNIMSQLQGKDPATLTRMLQELVPHYPDLQKIDIYALAQALSKMNQ